MVSACSTSLWLLLKCMTGSDELLTSMGKEKSQRSATRSTPSDPAARMTRKGSRSMVL